MPYTPYPEQARAHRAFLIDGYKRGVLYWSRRCFASGSMVNTEYGYIPIEQIRAGDKVWSFGEQAELKEVIKLHRFGVDTDPKPMIEFLVDGKKIKTSYDHEFYIDGIWIPSYQFTWGAMAPSQRQKLKLLCKQYGQALDHPSSWRLQDGYNETSTRRFWVLKDGYGRQNDKSPSSSSRNLDKQSSEQTADEPHQQRQDGQSDRQPGVGNSKRKPGLYDGSGSANSQRRRKVRSAYPKRETGFRDSKISSRPFPDEQVGDEQTSSQNISSRFREYPPYFKGQDLEISQVEVSESTPCYDLEVTDNQNYVVEDLLVGNTGKTLWSIQQIMWSCMLRQGPHHIVFKEYQQAETVAWNQYLHLIPPGIIKEVNKTLLTVIFHHFKGKVKFPWGYEEIVSDETIPPSSLRLLGSDKSDAHRGGESMGMIFDEYQNQSSYGWDYVYQPMLLTTDGWACFMGTAKDRDTWNDMLDRARVNKDWYFSEATWRSNPEIKPETIARLRKEAETEGSLGAFLQEHELIPFSQQGAVYPTFNRKIHVIDPEDVPAEGTDYVALDFGFAEGHPLAMCFIRITRDDIWYQWDEIHGTGIQLEDALGEMKYKLGDRLLTTIIADSARPDLIEWMASKGYPVVPSPKKQNSVLAGIDLLRKRIKPKIQIIGDPKPNYYVTRNCKKTIYDWTHYRFREIKEDRPPSELPEKKFDDSPDAIRYLELFFKLGFPKNDKVPDSTMLKELYM